MLYSIETIHINMVTHQPVHSQAYIKVMHTQKNQIYRDKNSPILILQSRK